MCRVQPSHVKSVNFKDKYLNFEYPNLCFAEQQYLNSHWINACAKFQKIFGRIDFLENLLKRW